MKLFTKLLAIIIPLDFTVVCWWLTQYSDWFYIPMVLGLLDARARLKDAHYIYRTYNGSNHFKLARMFKPSLCQRYALLAVLSELNPLHASHVREKYYDLGYRWYHWLPDGTFSLRSPYLQKKFYINLFLGKRKLP